MTRAAVAGDCQDCLRVLKMYANSTIDTTLGGTRSSSVGNNGVGSRPGWEDEYGYGSVVKHHIRTQYEKS